MTKWTRPLLLPLSPVYYIITRLRNILYDFKLLKSTGFDLPIISVGNLSAGGTGKTPHVEYLISILKPTHYLAVLSRGFGRRTKGFLLASKPPDPFAVGDESAQIKTHHPDVEVAVCENRVKGVDQLLRFPKSPEVILLDDAFQHRKIQAGFQIVLTTYDAPFFTDGILPGGNLREGRGEADRADVVVVTKCPLHLSEASQKQYRNEIAKYTPAKVFFSKMDHGTVRWLHPKKSFELSQKFLLVTGIANPVPFVNHLNELQLQFEHMKFPDHHLFTKLDIKKMRDKVKQNNLAGIVTTEKDATRFLFRGNLHQEFPIAVFPIQVVFEEKASFDKLIFQYIKEANKG